MTCAHGCAGKRRYVSLSIDPSGEPFSLGIAPPCASASSDKTC